MASKGRRHGTALCRHKQGGQRQTRGPAGAQRAHSEVRTVLLLAARLLEGSPRSRAGKVLLRAPPVLLAQVLKVGYLAEEAQLLRGPLLLEWARAESQPAAAFPPLLALLLGLLVLRGAAVAILSRGKGPGERRGGLQTAGLHAGETCVSGQLDPMCHA